MASQPPEIGWRKDILEDNQTTSNGLVGEQTNRIVMKKARRSSSSTDSSRSRSSSCSSSSSAVNSNCDENNKRKRKLLKKEKRHEEKKLKKETKRLERSERKKLKKAKKELHKEEKKLNKEEKRKRKHLKKSAKKSKKDEKGDDCAIPIDLMYTKAQAPETPEEYKARQSQIRREIDPITGRSRLIKGDGEILEEIVSRERHLNINKQATRGDGQFFQQNTINLNK